MTNQLSHLRRFIVDHYDLEEIRTLCFDLGIRYDDLGGEGLSAKARELILRLGRRRQLDWLLTWLQQTRPTLLDTGADLVTLEALYAALPSFEDTSQATLPVPGKSPFKGLQYFDEVDAHLFFGREQLTVDLIGRLWENSFLAVVGASGSGKSSVVRAGLVPALRRDEAFTGNAPLPNGSDRWSIHIITPTAHPLKELAASLTRDSESVKATATLIDDLGRDTRSLDLAVHKLLKQNGGGERLLLIVDQFEELFTACKDAVERRIFIDNLLYAVAPETEGSTIAVIALRADFYAHCAQFDRLRKALEKHQAYIGSMDKAELRQAIEEPAQRNGWDFEPGLVDLLLRDVGDEPGALPLLSHALLETWKRRRGHTLTLEGYQKSGGIHGAIAQTAETIFHQLTPEQQTVARNIFLHLTKLGEGTQDTRRRAPLTELISLEKDRQTVVAVLKTLVDARLITTSERTAEVAHEALIREWPMLREWLDEDREGLRIHRRLMDATQEWERLDGDSGVLYRGSRLAIAGEWAEAHPEALSAAEEKFLKASQEAEDDAQRKQILYESMSEARTRAYSLLANLSHNFLRPVNSIVGFSKVILRGIDGPLTDLQRQDLVAIYNSGMHLLQLLEVIEDFTMIETEETKYDFESIYLQEIIQHVTSKIAPALVKDKSIKVYQDVPENLPAIYADSRRIRQVMYNLIVNAAQYTQEGFIRVKATCDEDKIVVSFQDSGIGIPEDMYEAVFSKLESAHSKTVRQYDSFGLGLPISKEFVEAHGGEMWFKSIEGEGSTFYFSLPISGPDSANSDIEAII